MGWGWTWDKSSRTVAWLEKAKARVRTPSPVCILLLFPKHFCMCCLVETASSNIQRKTRYNYSSCTCFILGDRGRSSFAAIFHDLKSPHRWPFHLAMGPGSELGEPPGHPEAMCPQTGPRHPSGGWAYPSAPRPPYAPVGVGGWHLPGLDALQGALAAHHHAQVGVPIGVVALGLRGAVGPTGAARGEQPVNCSTRGKTITHLSWPSFLSGPPWAAPQLSAPWPHTHIPRGHQGRGKKLLCHSTWKLPLRISQVPGPGSGEKWVRGVTDGADLDPGLKELLA